MPNNRKKVPLIYRPEKNKNFEVFGVLNINKLVTRIQPKVCDIFLRNNLFGRFVELLKSDTILNRI